jgi:hypothetical protein
MVKHAKRPHGCPTLAEHARHRSRGAAGCCDMQCDSFESVESWNFANFAKAPCATAVALRVDCVAEMIPRTSELLQCPNSLLQLQVRSNFGTTHFKKNARPQCRCSSARHLLECVTAVENLDVVHALSMWCEYVKNSQFDTCQHASTVL